MSPKKQRIVGLGNALVDVVTFVEPAAVARHALTPGGMHLVGREAAEALYAEVGPGLRQSGGSVANTIAHLATEGAACAFIGKVADDALGAAFRDDLAELGVAFSVAPLRDGVGTGRCVVLVTPDGERTMSTYLGAAQALGPADMTAMPRDLALLLVEGYLWDSPDGAATIRAAAAQARAAGARIALTPSDAGCVQRNRVEMLSFIRDHCDVLIGNRDEVCTLAEAGSPEEALAWARQHARVAAVTLSQDGSLVADGSGVHRIAAAEVDQVVDTTGAGDAYAAGFLRALLENADMPAAGQSGAQLAGSIISRKGARPARASRHGQAA